MLSHEQLFTYKEVNADVSAMSTGLSRYVIEQLPSELQDVRDGNLEYEKLSEIQSKQLRQIGREIFETRDPRQAEINQLDLSMMLGSYLPLEKEAFKYAPASLMGLLAINAKEFNLDKYMSYELIIDVNSTQFIKNGLMRTYLNGEYGRTERDFYFGHFLAEPLVKNAFTLVNAVIDNSEHIDKIPNLELASSEMQEFSNRMDRYGKLTNAEFRTLRDYLGRYPDDTRNASGAFMPSVQLLELVLHKPTEHQMVYIKESMPYFPRRSRKLISEKTEQSLEGVNVEDMLSEGVLNFNQDEKELLISLVNNFAEFRLSHLRNTYKQVRDEFTQGINKISKEDILTIGEKDVLAEGGQGTAGFNIQNTLINSIYRLLALRERLVA